MATVHFAMDVTEAVQLHHLDRLSMYERGLLLTALHTMSFRHEGQFRDSGEPYRTHLVSVYDTVAGLAFPSDVPAPIDLYLSTLLHDILEDCSSSSLAMLTDVFGKRTAAIVLVMTKLDKRLYFGQIAQATARGLWEPIVAKLGDRFHNLCTIDHLEFGRIRRKLAETLGPLRECADKCALCIPRPYKPAFEEMYEAVFPLAEAKLLVYGV